MDVERLFKQLVSNFEGYAIVQGHIQHFPDIAKQFGCDILYYTIESEIDELVIFHLLNEKPKNKTVLFLNISIDVNYKNVSFILEKPSYCFCSGPNVVTLYNHSLNKSNTPYIMHVKS